MVNEKVWQNSLHAFTDVSLKDAYTLGLNATAPFKSQIIQSIQLLSGILPLFLIVKCSFDDSNC